MKHKTSSALKNHLDHFLLNCTTSNYLNLSTATAIFRSPKAYGRANKIFDRGVHIS
jgi:hypothetical protein